MLISILSIILIAFILASIGLTLEIVVMSARSDTPNKGSITQTAANTTKSDKLTFTFPRNRNAYRFDRIRCQIDDFDAIATADSWTLQASYDDQNGATLHTIDDKDEIFTIGEIFEALGTNGPTTKGYRDIASGWLEFELEDKYCIMEECWFNFDNIGQDAAEALHYEFVGKFVLLDEQTIRELRSPTSEVG